MEHITLAPAKVAAPYLGALLGILILGFGSAWLFSILARESYMDQDYAQWSAKMEMIARCDLGAVTVVGDSRASAAIIPTELLPLKVTNLALTGSTPVEAYYEVKHILDCPDHPKALVLSFGARQYQEIDWFWLHAARYGFLSFSELEDVRHTEASLNEPYLYKGSFGSEPPGIIKNWLYTSDFPPFNFASMLKAAGFGRRQINRRIRRETLDTGGQHLEGTSACAVQPGWEAMQQHFKLSPLVSIYLDRILALAEQRKAKIYFLMPPVSEMTAAALTSNYQREFAEFLLQVVHHHPNVELVGIPFPVMSNCSFGDEHHLNQTGALSFTQTIAPTFRKISLATELASH
jgi:hypothetical protein